MIPDLGKYADTVLSAYAASLVLMAALVVFYIYRSRKARRALEQVEQRMRRDG